MKRFNKVYVCMALLAGATEMYPSLATNAIALIRAIAANGPVKPVTPTTSGTSASTSTSSAIVPPQAPAQPLAPVSVSETAGLANFGTKNDVTLSYQVEQLPVTAQIDMITFQASFGSTQSSTFTFDAATLATINKSLSDGQALVVLVGTTAIEENVVVYAALSHVSDLTKVYGYIAQAAPAGVTQDDWTGATVQYQLATETSTNTITVTAEQNLFILNPVVSVANPLSGVSIQATFGSAATPVVSAPIDFDLVTVQAIQAALQAGDIVSFAVDAEYMFGLGEIVVTAFNVNKNTPIGNEATLAITQDQDNAGNFIAYVVNLSFDGQAGKSSYVRGINQYLELQVPVNASTELAFYVPADVSVSIPENSTFPNVTLNGIFSDGSSSSGFVFTPQDLQQINQAISQGDNVSIIVQQSGTGSTLIASAYNITRPGFPVLATATNSVTPAQAQQSLVGYALTYQLPGQTKPTTLQAAMGQAVTFGISVFFALPVDPSTFTQANLFDTRGFIIPQGGNSAPITTRGLRFGSADFAKIQAALTAGHVVTVGTGYSAEQKTMMMQAYDTVTKSVIAQVSQASAKAAQEPLFGFVVDYQAGKNAQGQEVAPNPVRMLVPGGNVLNIVPTTLSQASTVSGSVVSCLSRRNGPLSTVELFANFVSSGSSVSSDVVALNQHELSNLMQNASDDGIQFLADVANGYCVFSVWDIAQGQLLMTPKAVPAPAGTYNGFTLGYQTERTRNEGTIEEVYAQLKAAGAATIASVGYTIPAGGSFSYINFNVSGDKGYGYPFGQNPWGGSQTVGQAGLAADISSTLQRLRSNQWEAGISFLLVGLDHYNNFIADITKTFPSSFSLYIFDSAGNILSITPVPVGNMTYLSGTPSYLTSFPSLTMPIGVGGAQASTVSSNYPVLATVNIGSSPATSPAPTSTVSSSSTLPAIAGLQTVSAAANTAISLLTPQRLNLQAPIAAQSLILPSVTTPVSQLWFSPVFAQGFAELPLQTDPNLIAQINTVLAEGNDVQFVHQIVPTQYSKTVAGVDCVVSAYNMGTMTQGGQNPREMFTYVFPLVGVQTGSALQNNQWLYTNITYQFGSAPTAILANLQPSNPTFSISGPVNLSQAFTRLLPSLEGDFPGITSFYTPGASNAVTVAYSSTLTSLDMNVGAAGSLAMYVDLNTNVDNDANAVGNGQYIQSLSPQMVGQGLIILPLLYNVSGCNPQFITNPSTIGGGCTATCQLVLATLTGRVLNVLPPAANFEFNDNGSTLELMLNNGYANPITQTLKYGQPIILQLTGNPTFGA